MFKSTDGGNLWKPLPVRIVETIMPPAPKTSTAAARAGAKRTTTRARTVRPPKPIVKIHQVTPNEISALYAFTNAGHDLVFAATDDRLTNHRIGVAAKGRGIFANSADSPEECGFLVPAGVRRGNVQIAVSTGGESPRLAAELRKKLEDVL